MMHACCFNFSVCFLCCYHDNDAKPEGIIIMHADWRVVDKTRPLESVLFLLKSSMVNTVPQPLLQDRRHKKSSFVFGLFMNPVCKSLFITVSTLVDCLLENKVWHIWIRVYDILNITSFRSVLHDSTNTLCFILSFSFFLLCKTKHICFICRKFKI